MSPSTSLSREDLILCVELGKALTAELDPDRFLEVVLEKISEAIPATNWSVLLRDEVSGALQFAVTVGIPMESVRHLRLDPGVGIAGEAIRRRKTLVIPDVRECPFFDRRADELTGFRTESVICVPLMYGGEVVGVGEVVNPADLSDRTTSLLEIIAEYAAIAVVNTRRYVQIRDMSLREHVTGLYNTRHLYRFLQRQLRKGGPLSLIFLDMDNFKSVVDTYGHLNGTRALQEVAKTLDACIEEPAFAVSYGGDEFVVVLPGFTKGEGFRKAEEIRERMLQTTYLTGKGLSVKLSASFGLAACPEDSCDPETLMASADHAMFGAKYMGKNRVK